jgi:hypothetical protein
MNEKKPPVLKTLAWVYGIVSAFTAISIIGPILLERKERRERRSS